MRTKGTADDWYRDQERWQEELAMLREVVLASGLEETVKWGQPAYMDEGRNVLIVSSMKAGATVNFFKGALFSDPEGHLIRPGENSNHGRYLRFVSPEDIEARRSVLEAMVAQAIQVERSGQKVEVDREEAPELVAELVARMEADAAFRVAFEALTPGRKRAYNMHFAEAKRPATRETRITRCTERILAGKGLGDCICGHSKRPPRCDGTHKHYQ